MDINNISNVLSAFKDFNLVLNSVFDAELYLTEDKLKVVNKDNRPIYTRQKYNGLDYNSLLSFDLNPAEQGKELPSILQSLANILLKEYALSAQNRYSMEDGDFEAFFHSDMEWAHSILDKYL